MIPIIDIFAGPGGLGEGFSSLINNANNEKRFEIKLSIEKDFYAHETLKLRSFFRQFPINQVPEEYYRLVRGEITIQELYNAYPQQTARAEREAWCGTLGKPDETDTNGVTNEEVDQRIIEALDGEENWVLIGGPPCQAYSLVGRARRQEVILDERRDKRVGLYKEYLRIIAMHRPAIFIMENVKGILSANTENENIFGRILNDLSNPIDAMRAEGEMMEENVIPVNYTIYSLSTPPRYDAFGNLALNAHDYIIKSEEYGVPQRRHRVILLGIRNDIVHTEETLTRQDVETTLQSVIGNLPVIRSGTTRFYTHTTVDEETGKKRRHYRKEPDNTQTWKDYVLVYNNDINTILEEEEEWNENDLPDSLGEEFTEGNFELPEDHLLHRWYNDEQLNGITHHVSRKHLVQDLKRYLFAARYTEAHGVFPRMEDYQMAAEDLLPDHENATSGNFADRFRVQLPNIAATTVTSHISKDGHYFIHYDPRQVRSLTVREAARIQTFPDNYYFCGGRTQQFHQVGNAVPPYLAYQIAEIVYHIIDLNENG